MLILIAALLFLALTHINSVKEFSAKEYRYQVVCDSLLQEREKQRFETELAYNKSLADIRDKNKEEIITYYRDIISNFRTLSHAQKSLR